MKPALDLSQVNIGWVFNSMWDGIVGGATKDGGDMVVGSSTGEQYDLEDVLLGCATEDELEFVCCDEGGGVSRGRWSLGKVSKGPLLEGIDWFTSVPIEWSSTNVFEFSSCNILE